MADVTLDASIGTETDSGQRALVMTTSLIGYHFYIDGDGAFKYTKTTDGGATWGAAVTVNSATTQRAYDVWFDKQTPGDTGTLIHIWYFDATASDVFYRTLDTNGDSLGTERTVFAGASAGAGGGDQFVSGTKARGGHLLCVFNIDDGTESGTYQSTDAGVNWNSKANAFEANGDWARLFCGNEADSQDLWALYFDASADELTLKTYDDSGNSWSESSVIAGVVESSGRLYPFGGAIRPSDGHLIAVVATEFQTATADVRVFDINGAASIVEKTAIASNVGGICWYPAVFLTTGAIYIAYVGKRDGSQTSTGAVGVYYTKSVDGGATWTSGDTAYSNGLGANANCWTPSFGERLLVVWREFGNSDLLTNFANSVTVPAVTLAGNQPAGSGTIASRLTLQHKTVAGAQPAPSGTVAFNRLLQHVALAGSQPAATGSISGALGRFIVLTGLQPYDVGILTARGLLQHRNVAGAQPAAAGSIAAHWLLLNIALAGNQPAPSGAAIAFVRPKETVLMAPGNARRIDPVPRKGSIRTNRTGAL